MGRRPGTALAASALVPAGDRARPGVALNGPRVANDVARNDKSSEGGKDGEDYEFIPADFDEDAFIHREMVSFRTTSILFLWGIVAALVSWGLFAAVDGAKVGWLLGLGVATVFGLALKWIYPRLKADIKHFGKREWLGTGFLFFFTWLAFFIIAVNPPVSDFAPPRVDLLAGPPVQQAGGTVVIDVFYEDNDRVASHDFLVTGPNGDIVAPLEDLGRGHYRATLTDLDAGIYMATAQAEDANGHPGETTLTFTVVETALDVFLPDGARFDAPQDALLVQVPGLPACKARKGGGMVEEPCLRTVYLEKADGGIVTLEFATAEGGWRATSNFDGWAQGNNTFTVVAQIRGVHTGSAFVDGGELREGPYSIDVTAPLGEYAPKVIGQPGAPMRSVPGVGVVALGVGLLALAAFARRR